MKFKLALAIALLVIPSALQGASTVCTNGACVTCDGSLVCTNGNCTCNGVPVGGANAPARSAPLPAPPAPPASAREAVCPGAKVMLGISTGLSPFVYMRLGNREGWVLIDTGAERSYVDARVFGIRPGAKVRLDGSSLPTLRGGEFIAMNLGYVASDGKAPGAVIGIIGTDFLSRRTVEFHYDADKPYMVISEQRCSAGQLEAAGFVAIPQQGHFSANARNFAHGNIPVIFMRVGNVTAPAWVDSGYWASTKMQFVQVNESLAEKLHVAGIRAEQIGTSDNSNCSGTHRDDPVLQVKDVPLIFTNRDGQPLFTYGPPALDVLPASPCFKVWGNKEPFAMIGALQIMRWGAIVLDGLNERIWISRKRGAVWPAPGYQALALAWNSNGGFYINNISANDSLDNAKTQALSVCNEKAGNCRLATSVNGFSFACLAVARNIERTTTLHYAMRLSFDAARAATLESCAKSSGSNCELQFSICND